MLTLIENGEVYAPEPQGRRDVLIVGGRIAQVGEVDRRAVEGLGLELAVTDETDCLFIPGLIDPHEHLQDGSGEHISNLFTAVAACRAYQVTGEQLRASLQSFNSNYNPGRAKHYRINNGYVMVDYGHNPDAFAAVCRTAAKWHGRRVTGTIGVPGDRDDSVIEQAGRVAGRGFHRVIIKEDNDLREREKGEVAKLLCRAVNDESPETECRIVLDEIMALRTENEGLGSGQVIFVFYDELEPVTKLLKDFGAVPVPTMEEPRVVGSAQGAKIYSAIGA